MNKPMFSFSKQDISVLRDSKRALLPSASRAPAIGWRYSAPAVTSTPIHVPVSLFSQTEWTSVLLGSFHPRPLASSAALKWASLTTSSSPSPSEALDAAAGAPPARGNVKAESSYKYMATGHAPLASQATIREVYVQPSGAKPDGARDRSSRYRGRAPSSKGVAARR